ncbi:LamG-like jellyroll fold domain-containing protein [Actinoplanes palleronii]|uniref:LamG-like jellyroll fold domain-containing protein n=1 Tax=Actinoplanes palleronii TaxID=113570 RepID=UPI001943F7E4|nr:ricin-type beta-trefoil lectin domain protein [Actinoplanes palleronii]
MGVPPDVVPTERDGWPLSGLLSALRQVPALAAVTGLPKQERGGATGEVDHYVSTATTTVNGGAGTAPGRGRGIADPAQPGQPAQKKFTTPGKPGDATSFDKRTSKRLPKRSTATYDEFQNEDGSFTRVLFDERVNFKAADGSYQPIDTTLTKRGDVLETAANSIDVALGATGADGTPSASIAPSSSPSASPSVTPSASSAPSSPSSAPSAGDALATVTTASGYSMAYDLAGAAAVPAVLNGSTATYREILPGTDLELRTTNDGLKETLVLASPAAGHEWVFPLKLDGVTAEKRSDGSLELVAADGKVAMRVPRGYMQDSKVDPHSGAPAEFGAVRYDLITLDGGQALKVTADEAWLADPARQYPVRVDPTIETADTGDIFTDDSTSTVEHNGDNLPVGTWDSGTTRSRSFMHFDEFDDNGLVGTQIKSAKLFMFHTWSYNCADHEPIYVRRATTKWTVADIEAADGKLSAGPSYSSPIAQWVISDNTPACNNSGGDRGKGAMRSVALPTQTFNGWSTGTMSNFGLALTASETDSSAFKRFTSANYGGYDTDPRLELTYDYNTDPQVNEQYPAYGASAATLTPELIADASDPDNWPKTLEYNFFVYDKDQKTQIATSDWQAKKSWTVPAGTFSWNESYYWTVQVRDGLADNHEYLIKNLLVTPVPQPSITSALSQNSGQGFDPVIGNYTTTAQDAMVNTVGPPLEITRSYNSGDPRTGQAFGAGWSSIIDVKATEKPVTINGSQRVNTVVVTYPSGRELAFGRNNNGSYSSPAGQAATFTEVTTDGKRTYRLTEKDGTTYEFKQLVDGSDEYPVASIKDISGRAQTFTYTDGLLATITAASGRTLDLYWTETAPKHVAYVATDPVTPGDWDSVNTWWYSYTGDALTKVCPPDNWEKCNTYKYDTTGSLFPTATVNARPHSYWRLNETGDTKIAASSMLENGGADVGVYSGVTLGQTGPLAGSSATATGFNGTSAQLQIPANLASDGANQAISMWFKASKTGGDGVLYGQSMEAAASTAATTNRAYNPTLYVGADGQLMGGFAKASKLGASLGTLTAVGQGQCLTVPGNVSTNGTRLALANCAGTANQVFTWATTRQLQVTTGGVVKCVDTEDQEGTNGTDLVINTCASTAGSQDWNVQADGQIVSDYSGLCLDSVGDGSQTGALMQIWACGKTRPVDQLFLSRIHTPMAATATVNGVTSPVKVNDDVWHHVMLSASGNRQDLYLDGKPVAAETGVTVQDIAPASAFVGKGFLGGAWPNQSHPSTYSNLGTRDYFTGSVSDVALFDNAVDGQLAADLYAARTSVSLLTSVVRPSGNATAEISYNTATSRVSKVIDGNGETWTPETPAIVGSTKVYESGVLGGAPTNYWRMAESGVTDAKNEVNGGVATYSTVTLGSVDGPFGAALGKAASFNGTSSYVSLPTGVAPAGNSSVSMWFNTTTTSDVLLGMKSQTSSTLRYDSPSLWITPDGKLRALSPSVTPTAPLNSVGVKGKCADVTSSGTADGTVVQSYECNGSAAQNWTLVSGRFGGGDLTTVQAFGKCLTPAGNAKVSGTKIVLSTCNGNSSQDWEPAGGGLLNSFSGLCLDLPGSSKTNGTDLQLYTCNKSAAQTWIPSLASKAAVNDGKWHHVVLSTNGTAQTLYVDGAAAQSTTGSVAMAPSQMTLLEPTKYTLGGGYIDGSITGANWYYLDSNTTPYYKGSLAEVAFYASELDASQAQYQFKARDAVKNAPSGQINYVITGPKDHEDKATRTTTVNDLLYGRKVAEIDALGNELQYGYSGKGNLRTVTDGNGNMTINEYDVRGNVVSVTTCQDRSQNICSTSYSLYYPDATTVSPPANIRNDRLIEMRGAGSKSVTDATYLTKYEYDDQGNRISETDPLGRRTTISYTDGVKLADGSMRGGYLGGSVPAGLPWRVVKPGGGMQTILYLPNGDIAQTTDPAGATTRYEYDGLGRTVKEIDVVGGVVGATVSYVHDRLDRVVSVTDAATTNAVTNAVHTPVTTLSYDVDGLMTTETVSDATGGDAPRTVVYGYDAHGRRTSEWDQNGNEVKLGYDGFGQVNRQTHADGSTVLTNYDGAGNEVSTVVKGFTGDPEAPTAARDLKVRQLAYDPAGRLASETDGMGFVNEYKYTDNNLLVSVTRTNGCDPAKTPGCTKQSYVLENNTYDVAGNLTTQITNNGRTKTTRAYDAAGRNTSATLEVTEDGETTTTRTTTYTYSAEDELLSTSFSDGTSVLGLAGSAYDRLGRVRQQTSYLSADVTPTMRWKLDEKSGTTVGDTAGNSIGTATGTGWSTDRGGAATFAGGTSGSIAGPAPVDTLQPYTLSAWVKLDDKSVDRYVAALAGDIGSSALKVYYENKTNSWRLAMSVREADGETSWPSSASTYTSGSATADWTHLAVAVTPNPAAGGTNTAQLYVNGVVKAALSTTKQFNNQATSLLVGAQNETTGVFSGQIDDVQAYQKALSATEIGQLQAGTLPAAGAQVSRSTYQLDSDGTITSAADAKGVVTYIANDQVGRAVTTTGPAITTVTGEGAAARERAISRIGYNTFGEVTEQQDPNGKIVTNRYDGLGQMVEQTSPGYVAPTGGAPIYAKTAVRYNSVGQVVSSTDPLGAVTDYTYDQLGRTTKVVTPDKGVTRYTYDDNGELLAHTDPSGAQALSTVDYLGRTLTATEAVRQAGTGYTTSYTYDNSPWPTSVKSAGGVVTTVKYNSAGEQTVVTDAAGNATKVRYDGLGRPVKSTAPDGSYTTVAYDLLGRTVGTSDYAAGTGELVSTQSQRYDIVGNTLAASNAYNPAVAANTDLPGSKHETTFEYDEAGQLISQREPISSADALVSTFGYDVGGQQTRFTDGRGSRFVTTYNSWGLPESQIEPPTASTPAAADRTFTMSYDAGGRAVRLDSPGGVTATSEYDVMGRLTKSSGTGAQVATKDRTFTYDLVGRVKSFGGAAGANTLEYDDRGLVTSITGVSGNSSYAYNADGSLTTRTDGAGVTTYGYDTAGRPAKVDNSTAGVHMTYAYDALSRVKTIAYGGNTRSFTYNKLKQLESDEVKTSAGASVGKIAYGFDLDGNLTKKTTTGFNGASTNTYKYDWANRLIGYDNGVTPLVYAYDKSGNRIQAGTKTFTYDERNQLVSDSAGTTYTYSPRGTLTSTVANGVETKTVTDAFNQVISQGTKTGGTTTYSYDGLGRLILPNLTYTGLGNDVANDGATAYVRDVGDNLVGVASGTTQRYAWTDIHTDVVGEFEASGTALSGSVSYDPWGKVVASGGMLGKLGYQQEWTDQGTGKVNMLSRWYDPETGTFDTRDAASNSPSPGSGAANRFAYAEGNPMTNTDPSGEGVGGKCGQYDYACEVKKYQAALQVYNLAMEARDRDMKAVGTEIVRQEAEYVRALRESNTNLLDILLQVGIGMLLDMIGYNSVVGCLGGSIMDCVDLALSAVGPIKALKIGRSLYKAADRAFAGYRLWKRIVEGARTVMRRAQDLMNMARKKLGDLMSKVPKKPKPPKKKPKPPAKKKPKPKPKPEKKPAPSKPAKKPKPEKAPKKQDKPKKAKPQQTKQKQKDRAEPKKKSKDKQQEQDDDEGSETAETCPTAPPPQDDDQPHSFDPSTLVVMADGSTRPIAEVNVGDSVLTKDPGSGDVTSRQVTLLHSNRDLDLTDVTVAEKPADSTTRTEVQTEGKGGRSTRGPTESTVLHTTSHHPFWDATTGDWAEAADLVAGTSTLTGPDGELQYVTAVHVFAGAKVMRDLTVADIHTYYVVAGAGPVLVHNNNCLTPDERAHARASENAAYSTRPGNSTSKSGATGGYLWIKGHGTFDLSSDKLHSLIKKNMDEIPAEARPDPDTFFGSHVEVQAATLMRILAKQAGQGAPKLEARLMVSKPGGPCSFCLPNVAGMLPEGSALTVRSQLRQVFSEKLFEN